MRRLALALFMVVVACGGRGPPEPLKVVPPKANVAPGQALQFAVVPSTTSVVWSVQEPNGGSVTQAGLYTAPTATWGTFHVVATASPAVQASAVVTVSSPVDIVAVSPQSADACQPKQLVATVTGSSDTQVIWGGLDPACGALTEAGVFTPARVTGYCLVSAQAHADPTKVVQVQVDIAPERVTGVAVAPASATIGPGGQVSFAATVTTTCGTFPAGG